MKKMLVMVLVVASMAYGCGQQSAPVAMQKAEPIPDRRDQSDEAKKHFDQGFSYIGSAQAASDPGKREELFRAAEVELTNAINARGDYAEAYLNRGVLYLALGKANKAEADLVKARELDPQNADISYNLACLYSLSGKLDLSIDAIDDALRLGFNNVQRLRSDSDLAAVRGLKEFRAVLEKHKFFIF